MITLMLDARSRRKSEFDVPPFSFSLPCRADLPRQSIATAGALAKAGAFASAALRRRMPSNPLGLGIEMACHVRPKAFYVGIRNECQRKADT